MPQKTKDLRLCSVSSQRKIIAVSGIVLSAIGLLGSIYWLQIFNIIIAKKMTLKPNSNAYENWKSPPLTLHLDIYLFNWTNPDDFKNASTKPILEQCGPYRFIDKPDKVDIKWHPENYSVTYRRKSFYYFDASGSGGQMQDQITTLNAVALSAASKGKQWNSVRRKMVDVGLILNNQEIPVTRTAEELLFTGYSDNMLDMARAMPIFGKDVEVPFDRFGWFYPRNGSADLTGVFNVYTGTNDIGRLGRMHSWNYNTHTGFFDSYCGLVNGSAGEFQPPNVTPDTIVQLFTPDMCRTVPLDYMDTVDIEGIKGYKYVGGQRSIDNGSLYPENGCFCGGQCVPSGVMNISSCRFGSPVFMSYPHFYQADEYYVNQVEGLQPKAEEHQFYLILEPRTGISLEVAARFQVNMLVESIPGISLYDKVPRIFFPLVWFEQKARISPELANNLKLLSQITRGGYILTGALFTLGLALICWYPIKLMWSHSQIRELHIPHRRSGQFSDPNEVKIWRKEESIEEHQKLDSSPLLQKANAIIAPAPNTPRETKTL